MEKRRSGVQILAQLFGSPPAESGGKKPKIEKPLIEWALIDIIKAAEDGTLPPEEIPQGKTYMQLTMDERFRIEVRNVEKSVNIWRPTQDFIDKYIDEVCKNTIAELSDEQKMSCIDYIVHYMRMHASLCHSVICCKDVGPITKKKSSEERDLLDAMVLYTIAWQESEPLDKACQLAFCCEYFWHAEYKRRKEDYRRNCGRMKHVVSRPLKLTDSVIEGEQLMAAIHDNSTTDNPTTKTI